MSSYSKTFGQTAYDQFIGRGQQVTVETLANLNDSNIKPVTSSFGLSASVCDVGGGIRIAHVCEVLGTKYLEADVARQQDPSMTRLYEVVGHDTAAMILNDLSAVGARPFDVKLLLANQGKEWFEDTERSEEFYAGWKEAVDTVQAWFSGGETAGLHCTIVEGHAVFAGSAVGLILPSYEVYDGTRMEVGDRLVGWRSEGMMCNGFTYVHKELIPALPDRYETRLDNGQGEPIWSALLRRTAIIAPMVAEFRRRRLRVRMINNITGHGWNKIMRAAKSFTYVIEEVPPVPEIFTLMEDIMGMTREDSYNDYNRGLAGVVICAESDYRDVIAEISASGLHPVELGYVSKPEGDKSRVVIEPDNIILVSD